MTSLSKHSLLNPSSCLNWPSAWTSPWTGLRTASFSDWLCLWCVCHFQYACLLGNDVVGKLRQAIVGKLVPDGIGCFSWPPKLAKPLLFLSHRQHWQVVWAAPAREGSFGMNNEQQELGWMGDSASEATAILPLPPPPPKLEQCEAGSCCCCYHRHLLLPQWERIVGDAGHLWPELLPVGRQAESAAATEEEAWSGSLRRQRWCCCSQEMSCIQKSMECNFFI